MCISSYAFHPLTGSWFFVQGVNENVLLHVYLFPNASSSSTFSFNETLLQAECTGRQHQWNRCNILLIRDEEGLEQLVLFPVRGGISIVHLDHGFSSILNYTRISSDDLPCHPTTLWRQQNIIHLACLHLNQSGEHGECKVYRMRLNLDRSDLSRSSFEGQVRIFNKNYPELLTNFVISDSLQSCFIPGPQLYFAWFDRLYRSVSNGLVANDHYRPFTERCAFVTEVERYDDLHISALCPAGTQELVNLCTGDIEHSNLTTGLSRMCSHETVINVTDHSFVVINSSSSTHSVVEVDTGNVTRTRCVQGNSTAWLIIESSNLSVTVLRTDDLSILTLTTDNTLDGVSVGQVEVWGERYVGFANETRYLVKDINCLRGNPLFVLQFIPDLSLKIGDSPLQCIVQSSASIMPSLAGSVSTTSYSLSSIPATPSPTPGISSTMTYTAVTQSPTLTIPARTSSKQNAPVIVGVISGLVVLAAVVLAAIAW